MTTEDVYEGISIANHYPNDLKSIGLHVIPNFISNQEEHDLMEFLDSQKWNGLGIAPNPELKRRTQQYGYLFSYRYRQIQSDQTQLPEPFLPLLSKFNAHKYYLQNQYNHLVINEYEKNQGIMPHIDAPKIFGDTIASLSMLSDCVMTFTEKQDESIEYKVHLPRYSVIVMTGYCRYKLKHSISKNDQDKIDDLIIDRSRRVSITFRQVLPLETKNSSSNIDSME